MEIVSAIIDIVMHAERYLDTFAQQYGVFVYILLFLIIFCETGLIVTPFLPGDSLLFAIGALAARGTLDVVIVAIMLPLAAIIGDNVNFHIGRWVGPRVFHYEKSRWFNPRHLKDAHAFYERYGGITITLGRFIPIVRTFVPFVAGVGDMKYAQFMFYNVLGGLIWVIGFLAAGFFFGNIPFVKANFKLVVVGIIAVSFIPIAAAMVKRMLLKMRERRAI